MTCQKPKSPGQSRRYNCLISKWKMFLVDSLAVLMASYSSRKDKEAPIQMRRIIKRKQLKKAYKEYG